MAVFVLSFALYPLVGVSFFPRTDAGQFVINVKAPTGTRMEMTEGYVKKVEDIVRRGGQAGRLEYDRFEHRRHARSFGADHAQLRHAHRVRPSRLKEDHTSAASCTWTRCEAN